VSKRRVVVTGLGIVSPVGSDITTAWSSILAGRSGIKPITRIDAAPFATRFAGEVEGFDVGSYIPPKEARRMDPFMHYGMGAGIQAVADSGLDFAKENGDRCGAIMGSGIGGLAGIEDEAINWERTHNPKKTSPFYIPSTIGNMVAGHLSIKYGLRGPNLGVVSACTTSTHSIGFGMRCIQYGDADIIVAGGSECATTPTALAGFSQARALSERNDDPQSASRPWDKDRDGFVMGDGGGAVILEELEHARARGARIYAECLGFGMSGDAYHITAPPEDGAGARLAMVNALRDAQMNPEDIHYLNAHATSTPLGDKAETIAIKSAFGPYAYKLPVSSTKSMTGHLLGAAGVVEAIFSVLAIRDGVAPPTTNYHTPDPDCDLDYVPNTARKVAIEAALSNSFGFGGTNGSLIFRRFKG
jgi:3-oxoacyl-[acyl-carrier-protein] synthase II